jgi:hypothetical protein
VRRPMGSYIARRQRVQNQCVRRRHLGGRFDKLISVSVIEFPISEFAPYGRNGRYHIRDQVSRHRGFRVEKQDRKFRECTKRTARKRQSWYQLSSPDSSRTRSRDLIKKSINQKEKKALTV